MARPLKPFIRGGGYYPSRRWTPLVYPGGYTTANGGGQPEPAPVLKTVTGSLIHITDALALPAEALSVNVEPIQDLHGQASPYPAGGGPNKLPPLTSETKNGVTITVADDGTITINGEATTDSYFDCNFTASWSSGDTYYFRAFNPVASTDNRLSLFVITSSGNPQVNLNTVNAASTLSAVADVTASKWRLRVPSGVTYSNFIVKPMFQVGGTAPTAYAPYSNICPISGRTSATVTRTGVNIWDEQWELGGIIIATGQPYNVADRIRSKNFCTCKPNTRYFVKAPSTFLSIFWYDANKIYLSRLNVTPDRAVTFPDNAYFFKIVLTNATTYGNDISINYPETASTYEPYQGNTYTIQLGDTVYGGTLDVTGGKMVVDRAMVDMGTLAWKSGFSGFYSTDLINQVKIPSNVNIPNAICSVYPWGSTGTDVFYIHVVDIYLGYVIVRTQTYSTPADFKSAMTGQQLCYHLATPIEITITPTQIDMLLGTNNLWADAGDSTLTYYAEGEASTSEALGILLGGTYNNPGGADDASDDEALGILLGGS